MTCAEWTHKLIMFKEEQNDDRIAAWIHVGKETFRPMIPSSIPLECRNIIHNFKPTEDGAFNIVFSLDCKHAKH